jgi:hypothetical protein
MTKKTYRSDIDKPSDMFVDSIGFGVGSADMECGWCGRMHLCPDTDYDPPDYGSPSVADDRERFKQYCEEEKKNNPDGVVLHYDADGISGKQLNGINFVVDCPCNGLERFEKFIWNERETIRTYLKRRIDHEYELAQQEKTLNKLAGFETDYDPEKERYWWQ